MLPVYASVEEVPLLDIDFPRPVTRIHQIELSSCCNLRCAYCAHKTMQRPKVHMSMAVLNRALDHLEAFLEPGRLQDLNIAGIGETTLHPNLDGMLVAIRSRLGDRVILLMATNGVTMTPKMADLLARHQVLCWVSIHRPEKAGPAMELLGERRILAGASTGALTEADDWAGQVKWFQRQSYVTPCMWLREGRVMITADGGITACCLDASGAGVIGNVVQDPGTVLTHPSPFCWACQQEIGVTGYDQRRP